jgi:hypothetical protein
MEASDSFSGILPREMCRAGLGINYREYAE